MTIGLGPKAVNGDAGATWSGTGSGKETTGRATTGRATTGRGATGTLVVTADEDLLDDVLAAAAAAGVVPTVMDDPAAIRGSWLDAPMIIVGADRAPRLADLVLPHRAEVVLVGRVDHQPELERWSAPLGAAVAVLPDAVSWLTTALADLTGRGSRAGRIVAVVGGAGGVGASTLAAALAVAGAAGDAGAMLVDLDPLGGGVDLLMGVENQPGWRWPRLASAQGHVGDLRDQLPRAAGVSVLATGRGPDAFEPIEVQAVKAVLTAAMRHHRWVVVDLPREPSPSAREALRLADATLLLTTADVRGVAAGRQLIDRLADSQGRPSGAVIRRTRAGGIEASLCAQSLELDLLAVLRDDPTLIRSAETGEPPGRSARSVLGRSARAVLAGLGLGHPVSDRVGP